MKNLFKYLFISIIAVSLIACSEDMLESTTTVGEPIEISINASAGGFTRAAYTEGDSGYAFSWSYNDQLGVFNSSSSRGSTFTTTSTANSSSATFTGTIDSWSGAADLYLIHGLEGDKHSSINTSDATVTYVYGNDVPTSTSSTTNINNMGVIVGVIEDATTTNIPDATLNQAMSFLQIKFDGLSTESLDSFELSTSSGESLFVTSAKIDIATGEIKEVLTTSNALNCHAVNIDAINNIWTIPLLPTDMTSTIILSCNYGDYKFSTTECNGFFERNTVYSGSININKISDVEHHFTCNLEEISSFLTADNTVQVQNITVNCENNKELTCDDFEGLRAFLKNQNRKNVGLTLSRLYCDIPSNALAGIDTFNELNLEQAPASSIKIGSSAFKRCSSLGIIHLDPACYYEIGNSSFDDCVNLQSIERFGFSQITSIGKYAFNNCANLSSPLYLKCVTYIDDYAFYNCNKIDYILFGEENSDIKLSYLGTGAFSGDSGSYTEDKDLYLYDSNAIYLTGDKTFNVSSQTYTFNTIYLNDTEYVHDTSSSSDDPAISVNNATKVTW